MSSGVMPTPLAITAAVEGLADEVLVKRLCSFLGATLAQVHGRQGKQHLLTRLGGYNHSARFRPWLVLLDLDDDAECAPEIITQWLPEPSPLMCLRVAVRELEAWLLADAERIARFLSVSAAMIPADPDGLADPKRAMVELAVRSRRRSIREDMVPALGSGQPVGPAYTSRLIEFIQDAELGWRPEVAAKRSNSLERCIAGITALVGSSDFAD